MSEVAPRTFPRVGVQALISPIRVAARRWIASAAIWTALGLFSALHLHAYYSIDWPLAFWWGLKDWYLWAALALLIARFARRIRFSSRRWLLPLLAHGVSGSGTALVHAVASVWLSSMAEGLDQPFVLEVEQLFLKKLVLSALIYGAIVILVHQPLGSRDSAGDTNRSPTSHPHGRAPVQVARILVKRGQQELFLSVDKIERIEACGNYVRIHAGPESYLERRTLSSLQAQLGAERFLRIHRSHLVNIDRICRIEPGLTGGHSVILEDGVRLSLSRIFRKELERRIGRTL